MEIDLELPSGPDDKLDAKLDKNIGHGAERLYAGEEEVNSGADGTDGKRNLGLNDEGVDEDAAAFNTFGKEIYNLEPQNGLEFESKEAAYSFYREYARSVGFGITIKASRRSKKSGKFIDVKIACSRFGSKRDSTPTVNVRSCPKTDCKASMHMKRRQDGKWFIYSFVKEHNHEICPDDFYCALRERSKKSDVVACQEKGLQLALDEADVQVLLDYFMVMQDENPSFFYAIDLDHEKRMRNVFWVDAKSRHDYIYFNDVVFFNCDYIRKKFKVPFVPIFGVNHHFQLMLLGCALIGEEISSTYVWLMRTWLRAVGGQTPKVIVTDEGKSLEEATAEVFPDTRHCFCLWCVLQKIPENLDHIVNSSVNFMSEVDNCVNKSWTNEEFEKNWWKMIDKFELREDDWIQSLYENRKKWVPTYMSDAFLAGFCTTERSECLSSLFDKYIHRDTTTKEFIHQYKAFLHDRYEEEARANFETHNYPPAFRSPSPFEKQMAAVYTNALFKKFQVEVLGTVACSLQKECEDEEIITFRVDDFEKQQNFIVAWNEAAQHICCLCRSFEYRGILCRHAMIVLQMSGVSDIPSHYILPRWSKGAKSRQLNGEISMRLHYRVQRFNDLCKRAIKLGEEGSLSQETYNIAIYALQEAMERCVGVNNSVTCISDANIEEQHQTNNPGKVSKKKKIHKKRKVQSGTEVVTSLVQDSNQQMGQPTSGTHSLDNTFVPQQDMPGVEVTSRRPPAVDGYYGAQSSLQGAHSLDNTFVSQQDMTGMEVSSRAPAADGYYGAQPSIQGVGHVSSLPSIRDGYYGNQQGMQGLLNSIPMRVGHYAPQQSLQGLLQGQLGFRAPTTMHGCFNFQSGLQDVEQPGGSRQFHNNTFKCLHHKRLPQ